MQIMPPIDMDLTLQYAKNMFSSISQPLYLYIGTAFAFFVLGGLLNLFYKHRRD